MSLISTFSRRQVAALCALLIAMPTWAAVRSTATAAAGPMTVQVSDMRADDAVAAGVTFASAAAGAAVSTTVEEAWPYDHLWHAKTGSWQEISVDAVASHTEAYAAVGEGGSSSPVGATMHLSGSTRDVDGSSYAAQAAMLGNGQWLAFSLTPWSALSLNVDVSGTLETLQLGDQAEIVFELMLSTSTGVERFDTFTMACSGACIDSNGRMLTVTLPNESDMALDGLWTLSARVAGSSVASPVPETGSGVLLMSGLALMGFVARRRARP